MSDGTIPVTVVMRSYNDAALLPRTLAALRAQRGVTWRLVVFESASTDGSVEILERFGCAHIVHLEPGSYRSSVVLNRGVAMADTGLVAFVNSDAVMLSDDVLLRLAQACAEDGCAGAYARQVPRADAGPMTRLDYHIAFDRRDELRGDGAAMSLVCSMIRRTAWEEIPFDEALTFAEDCVWAREVAARGWTVRYVREAAAEHSHEYTWAQRYRRAYGDAAALAVLDQSGPAGVVRGLLLPWAKRCVRDAWRLVRMGEPWQAWRVPAYRWPLQLGAWRGARDGWHHFHADAAPGRTLQPTAR